MEFPKRKIKRNSMINIIPTTTNIPKPTIQRRLMAFIPLNQFSSNTNKRDSVDTNSENSSKGFTKMTFARSNSLVDFNYPYLPKLSRLSKMPLKNEEISSRDASQNVNLQNVIYETHSTNNSALPNENKSKDDSITTGIQEKIAEKKVNNAFVLKSNMKKRNSYIRILFLLKTLFLRSLNCFGKFILSLLGSSIKIKFEYTKTIT